MSEMRIPLPKDQVCEAMRPRTAPLSAVKAVALGLAVCQVIATCQVYLSNQSLYRLVEAITAAGYLAVPNVLASPSLKTTGAAISGGLFFTLTVGAGLSLLAFSAAWLQVRFNGQAKGIALAIFLVWMGLLGLISRNGFNLFGSLYCTIIPLVVFAVSRCLLYGPQTGPPASTRSLSGPVFMLLIVVWLPLLNKAVFVDVRDFLLLSNPIGMQINQWYYKYTLYAAQVIKPLEKKTVKGVFLDQFDDRSMRDDVTRQLLKYDYLPVTEASSADLHIQSRGDNLHVFHRNKEIVLLPAAQFIGNASASLLEISQLTDRSSFLRTIIFLSALIAYPVCLYIFLYGLCFGICRMFVPSQKAGYPASLAVLLIGIILAWPLYLGRMRAGTTDPAGSLQSQYWQERVAALRMLADTGESPASYVRADQVWQSSSIPERYWFVKAVGNSRENRNSQELLAFLNDSSVNVVCMAYEGLGKSGDPLVLEEIFRRFPREENWYIQWYAYRAMRGLGWQQAVSP